MTSRRRQARALRRAPRASRAAAAARARASAESPIHYNSTKLLYRYLDVTIATNYNVWIYFWNIIKVAINIAEITLCIHES